jgi:hypothetical protein
MRSRTVYIYCHTVNEYAVMYGVYMWSCTVYTYDSGQPYTCIKAEQHECKSQHMFVHMQGQMRVCVCVQARSSKLYACL